MDFPNTVAFLKEIFLKKQLKIDLKGEKIMNKDRKLKLFDDLIAYLSENESEEDFVFTLHAIGFEWEEIYLILREGFGFPKSKIKELNENLAPLTATEPQLVEDEKENKVIELYLRDTEDDKFDEHFIIINPDPQMLDLFKKKMAARIDEEDEYYDEDFNAYDFVTENFNIAEFERLEIPW